MPTPDQILRQNKDLVHAIEAKLHINLYEHQYPLVAFVGSFVLFAAFGTLSGGLLDKVIVRIQGSKNDKRSCAAYLFVNVLIDGLAFYALFTLKRNGMRFDDWLMGTFNGFIFALTLFNAQEKLSQNVQCLVL